MTAFDDLITAALYSRITTDGGLSPRAGTRVFDTNTPGKGVTGDYILFQQVSGGDENTNPRESLDTVYLFKYVSADQSEAKIGIGLLHDALHEKPLTISGWTNWRLVQTDLFTMPSGDEMSPDGKRLYVKGAYYRISIDKEG